MDITVIDSLPLSSIVPDTATAVCGELATTQTRLEQLRVLHTPDQKTAAHRILVND